MTRVSFTFEFPQSDSLPTAAWLIAAWPVQFELSRVWYLVAGAWSLVVKWRRIEFPAGKRLRCPIRTIAPLGMVVIGMVVTRGFHFEQVCS